MDSQKNLQRPFKEEKAFVGAFSKMFVASSCVGPVDLTEARFWNVTDAAISIEVGEHIPAELETAFLDNLVNSARQTCKQCLTMFKRLLTFG